MTEKFQPNLEIIRLYSPGEASVPVIKVGILPFVREGNDIKILFMKPKAEAKHFGEPTFQIAKGTRRTNVNGNWVDMREDDLRYADESFLEPLMATALREGGEETGLKPANIIRLYDVGGFTFTSTNRGIARPIHMFAAEIKDKNDFAPFEKTTAATQWLTPEEFAKQGRADHHAIVKAIVDRLK